MTDLKRMFEATHVTFQRAPRRNVQSNPSPLGPRRRTAEQPFYQGCGARAIVLDVGSHVWVASSYAEDLDAWPEITQVGGDKACDAHGNCVRAVPAEWCTFLDEDEANAIEQAYEIDQAMLANAY